MQQVRFEFDMADGPAWDGFATGTTWNGYDNVMITPETAHAIDEWDAAGGGVLHDGGGLFDGLPRNEHDLIDLSGGYVTKIVTGKALARCIESEWHYRAPMFDIDVETYSDPYKYHDLLQALEYELGSMSDANPTDAEIARVVRAIWFVQDIGQRYQDSDHE